MSPTTDPHGSKTVSGVTTPAGRSGTVVVVVGSDGEPWVVPGVSPGSVTGTDGSVVTGPSGVAETRSVPATHADTMSDTETRRKAALRIHASVEMEAS